MLAMGKPAWSVRMLAALAVLTMLFPWSDGLVMTKCDLKAQLEEEISQLQGENLVDMIAKLVCTAERISAFNTSLVTITDYYDLMNQRYRRSATLLETRKRRSDPLNTEGSGMSGDGSGDESFYQYEGSQIPERSVDPIMDYDPYGFLPGEGKRKKRSIDGSKLHQVRKRRSDPSSEEDSAMSGDGSGDESTYQYEGTQIPERSVDPIMDYDPYYVQSGEGKRKKRSIDGSKLQEIRKRRSDPSSEEEPAMSGDGSGDESFYQYEGTQIPDRSVDPIMDYDPYYILFGESKRKKRSIDGSKLQEVRKRRSDPSSEEDPAMSGDGSGDESFYQYEGTQIPERSVDPIMDYDPYGFLSGEGKRKKRSIDGSKLHQVRKRRSDPSSEEDSAISGDGSGDESFYQYEGTQIPDRSVDPIMDYDPYYILFGQSKRKKRSIDGSKLQEVRKRRSDPSSEEDSAMSGDGSGDESFYQYEGSQIPERSVDPIMDYDPYYVQSGEGKRKKRSIDGSKLQEVRKRRSDPSSEEEPAMSGDGSGDESFYQYEGEQIPDRSVDPIMDYDPYYILFGQSKRKKRSIDGSKLQEVRKRRSDPSSEEDPAMSGDGSGDESFYQYEGSQIPERSVDPIMDYDPYGFLSGEGKRKKRSIDGSKLQEVRTRRSDPSNGEDPIILQYYGTLDGPGGQASDRQTTFYGIFQLSDQACNSGSFYQDLDQCGLDCSDLIDDDITDDIACLMTLDKYVKPMTLAPECLSVDPSQYFTECD